MQHGILRAGDRGVHEHAVAAEFHRDRGIGSGADAGVDDDRHLRVLDDFDQVPAVLDAEARTDRRGQRHHRDAADFFEPFGQDRIVAGVDHDLEAVGDELLGGLQGLHDVGEQRLLVAEHFQLDQRMAVEQFAREAAGAHGVLGGVAAGRVRQDRVAIGRQHVEQVRLARVLADVGAADRDGDDLGAGGLGGASGFRRDP